MKDEKKEPVLTVSQFDEKTQELNKVFINNANNMQRVFMGKQAALFARLSPEDQEFIKTRELEKIKAMQPKVESNILSRDGKPIRYN